MNKILIASLLGVALSLGATAPSFAAKDMHEVQALKEYKEMRLSVGETDYLPYEDSYLYAIEPIGDSGEIIRLTSYGKVKGLKRGTVYVSIKDVDTGKLVDIYKIRVF
ncbi:hypothetical protein QJQ58_01755 [Paenibacillus dendritiformis]|uniref:hypothetical protein n=1 Tax=Paenibacillus dendritiformis TaxID=130049 RepID=UPI00248B01E5|nr:hypothetical protein [Paenibacillus dendritiformis]WGU95028.1 hypothetical protein QJQ58_01755 [Paenibacillus dendritiformis]